MSMTLTVTYDATLARVVINATGMAFANISTLERSSNGGVTWTIVRGAAEVAVTAGAIAELYDYEFTPGVVNQYRLTSYETDDVDFVAAGVAATGNNASVSPAFPAGIRAGDTLMILASIRNSPTGTPNTPAGYTLAANAGSLRLFTKRYDGSESAKTVTFTGGVANADTIAQYAALRRAAVTPLSTNTVANTSAQNVNRPTILAAMLTDEVQALIFGAWKQDDSSAFAMSGPTSTIGYTSTTTGDDASQKWEYLLDNTLAGSVASSFTVTGGASAISLSLIAAFGHADFFEQATQSITPTVDEVWLKSTTRPFLNRTVQVVNGPTVSITRPARNGINEVKGRTLPVGVSDVRSSRRTTVQVRTETADDGQTMEYIVASGDIMFVQVPYGCRTVQSGYFLIGDVDEAFHPLRVNRRTFTLPMTEIAAPGPYVAAAESSWASVLAAYGSWAEVLADNPTWADLLARRGQPSEVIVE